MPEHPTTPTPATALPDWLPPPDVGLRITPCGVRFDAVRVSAGMGAVALEILGDRSGPVIADQKDDVLYWLCAPGTAANWQVPVTVWGSACYVTVPAAEPGDRRRFVHWLVPPAGDCLTDPDALHAALTRAHALLRGPRPETTR